MSDFMPKSVAAESVGRIAQNKEASLRMNPARPLFQMAERLELLPISRPLKNINVRFRLGRRGVLLALEFHRDHSIVKLRLHRDRGDHIAANEMVDEMLGLAVFPLFRLKGERLLAERIGIALAQAGKLHLGQSIRAGRRSLHLRRRRQKRHSEDGDDKGEAHWLW